jgi:hypothetical protein
MTPRHIVYFAIDSERNYQDEKWAGHKHSFDEYAYYMEQYLAEFKAHISHNDSNDPVVAGKSRDFFRKITAMGVAAMEENGTRERAGY